MRFAETLDPRLRAVFEHTPGLVAGEITPGNLAAARALALHAYRAAAPPLPESVTVSDISAPGLPGQPEVRIRLYRARAGDSPQRGLVYMHGGGFVAGDTQSGDPLMCKIVRETGCVVASVDYRLAPEHPYPAGLDDCMAALHWMAGNGAELGVAADRLIVGGASAGGCLAAAVALRVRDEGGPAIAFQLLVIPITDDRLQTPSCAEIADDARVWNTRFAAKAWRAYLADRPGDTPAHAAPARATDLSGLPPALVTVEDHDCLRDEGIDYAQRLMQAGVPVELHVFPGTYHGSFGAVPGAAVSRRHVQAIIDALARV